MIPLRGMLEAVVTAYAGWYVKKLGAIKPEWYVFPFSNRRRPVDPERPVTFMRAQFAMIGVIYRNKCIDTCMARSFEFHKLQFASELW